MSDESSVWMPVQGRNRIWCSEAQFRSRADQTTYRAAGQELIVEDLAKVIYGFDIREEIAIFHQLS